MNRYSIFFSCHPLNKTENNYVSGSYSAVDVTSTLETAQSVWETMNRCYANTAILCKGLEHLQTLVTVEALGSNHQAFLRGIFTAKLQNGVSLIYSL